jgi:hypothetical protein
MYSMLGFLVQGTEHSPLVFGQPAPRRRSVIQLNLEDILEEIGEHWVVIVIFIAIIVFAILHPLHPLF